MMMPNNWTHILQQPQFAAQAIADHRVLLHERIFSLRQRAGLQEHRVWNADFADVMQEGSTVDGDKLSLG